MIKKILIGIAEAFVGAALVIGTGMLILSIYAGESGLPMPWEGLFG